MEYRRFQMTCTCGGEPKQISAIGFSAAREIVLHWRCPRCRKNICTVKPLSDAYRDCFPGASIVEHEIDTPEDRRFLQSLGVRYADE
jgi:hypothetical protein